MNKTLVAVMNLTTTPSKCSPSPKLRTPFSEDETPKRTMVVPKLLTFATEPTCSSMKASVKLLSVGPGLERPTLGMTLEIGGLPGYRTLPTLSFICGP